MVLLFTEPTRSSFYFSSQCFASSHNLFLFFGCFFIFFSWLFCLSAVKQCTPGHIIHLNQEPFKTKSNTLHPDWLAVNMLYCQSFVSATTGRCLLHREQVLVCFQSLTVNWIWSNSSVLTLASSQSVAWYQPLPLFTILYVLPRANNHNSAQTSVLCPGMACGLCHPGESVVKFLSVMAKYPLSWQGPDWGVCLTCFLTFSGRCSGQLHW